VGLKDKLIQETAALIGGETYTIVRNGVEIIFRVYWETADYPDFDIQDVKIIRKLSFLEKMLMDSYGGLFGSSRRGEAALGDLEWHPIVSKTKPFIEWDRRIKKVCDEADILEKTKKICFDSQILEPAEKLIRAGKVHAM